MSEGLDPESWDGNSVDCHGGPLPPTDDFSTQPGFGDSLTALGRIGLVAALETGDPDVRADALQPLGRRLHLGATHCSPRPSTRRATSGGPPATWTGPARSSTTGWRSCPGTRGRTTGPASSRSWPATTTRRSASTSARSRCSRQEGSTATRRTATTGSARSPSTTWRAGPAPSSSSAQPRSSAATPDAAASTYRSVLDEVPGLEQSDYVRELTFYARLAARLARAVRGRSRGGGRPAGRCPRPDEYPDGPPGPGDEVGWGRQSTRLSSGAQDNNLALALAKLGRA